MFKNRNLPKDALPWGREVENRIEDIESALRIIKSYNLSNSSQLQSVISGNAVNSNNIKNGIDQSKVFNLISDLNDRPTEAMLTAWQGFYPNTIETTPRWVGQAGGALTSGNQTFYMFSPLTTLTLSNISMVTSSTAAASGLTYAAMGLYSVDLNDNATLVAYTANDTTTLFTTINTLYTRKLNVNYTIQAGSRYAVSVLCVGTTMPGLMFNGIAQQNAGGFSSMTPRVAYFVTGQSTLLNYVDSNIFSTQTNGVWARLS